MCDSQIGCVITGDIVNSSKMPTGLLTSLLEGIDKIVTGHTDYLNKQDYKQPVIACNKSSIFLGDSFQFATYPLYGLEHLIMMRLYCKSFFSGTKERGAIDIDVRLSMGLSLGDEPIDATYKQAYVLSGRGLDINQPSRIIVSVFNDPAMDGALYAMGVLLDALITPLTAKQSRNLLIFLTLKSVIATAQYLGINKSSVSRSIAGVYYPIQVSLAQYHRMIVNLIE